MRATSPRILMGLLPVLFLVVIPGMTWRVEDDPPKPPTTEDEYFDLHENVINADTAIKRLIRSVPRLKRAPERVSAAADKIVEHGKLTRECTVYAEESGEKTPEEWVKLTDAMLKHGTELAEATKSRDTVDVAKAQAAYKAMTKACNTCHKTFRDE